MRVEHPVPLAGIPAGISRFESDQKADFVAVALGSSADTQGELGRAHTLVYRPDIDGLRAVAIALVVLFHAGVPTLSGGFIGVDVFFVLSGYLITSILWSELAATGTIDWGQFYARRFRRLVPAAVVVTLGTLVVGAMFLISDPDVRWLGQSAVAASTFLSNVFFMWKTEDYFGATAHELPLLHTWSLAVEEQFYVVWPVLMWVAFRLARRWRGSLVSVWVLLGGAAVASFAASVVVVSSSPSMAFYLMPFRLWELAVGGLVAVSWNHLPPLRTAARTAASLIGLALIIVPAISYGAQTTFPGLAAALPVIGTALLIVAGRATNVVSTVLGTRPLVMLGKLSYSWYLLHWPMLVLVWRVTLSEALWRDLAICAAALVGSVVMYRFVEEPIRHRRVRLFAPNRGAILGGLAALIVTAAIGLGVSRSPETLSVLDLSESERAALVDRRDLIERCPQLPRGAAEQVDCTVGSGDGRVLLVGDSHAVSLADGVSEALEGTASIDVLWSSGCPYAPGFVKTENCERENVARHRHLLGRANDTVGVVITSLSTATVTQHGDPSAALAAKWAEALEAALWELSDAGLEVVYVLDVPHFDLPVPDCSIRELDRCGVDRAAQEAARLRHAPIDLVDLEAIPGVHVFDPFDEFCDDSTCVGAGDDEVWFYDDDHLSSAGARKLSPSLAGLFASLGWLDTQSDTSTG